MKKLSVILGIIFLITLVSATIYQEPWSQNQDGDQHNLTNMDYIIANYFNGEVIGSMDWTNLKNYPVACPGSSAITGLNDSVTCSDLWVDTAGDTWTGSMDGGGNNLTNVDSISADRINEVLYVQAGNGSDIQAKIDMCSSDGYKVIIPEGNYALDNTVYLKSNLTLINYGNIYWNIGATPQNLTDVQSTVYTQMIYGNNTDNIKIYNYGILQPTKETNPSGGEIAIFIDNSENIKVMGGHCKKGITTGEHCIGIYNSNNTEVFGVYSDEMNAAVWQECTIRANIHDIICIAGKHEGECIEMNGYSQYVTISNIIIEGGSKWNDQSIDLNANKYVTLNNIVANEAYRLVGSSAGSGIRFGTCSAIVGSDITGTNLQCHNCNVTSIPSTTNSSWDILEGNLGYKLFRKDYGFTDRVLIGGNDSTSFSVKGAELEITDIGTYPLLFLYPTGTSNPSTAGKIAFGEGNNAITHFIQLNGSSNSLEIGTSEVGNVILIDRTGETEINFNLSIDTSNGGHGLILTRTGSSSEASHFFVDDKNLVIESIQDENSGDNGGFVFKLDDDGTADPFYLIETSSGTDIFKVSSNTNLVIGDGTNQKNITMTSPDGTEYSCGVANGGAFSCS